MVDLSNVTSVTIDTNEEFFKSLGYNGSWHVIDHETTDDVDYSIAMYEMWYEAEELGYGFIEFIEDHFSEWYPHIKINK